MSTRLWELIVVVVMAAVIIQFVRYKSRKHEKKNRNDLLARYRGALISSGVKEVNAAALADLQIYISERALENQPSLSQSQVTNFLKLMNRACESIRLRPDEVASKKLETIVLSFLRNKKTISDNNTKMEGILNFWYDVVFWLTICFRNEPIFVLEPLAERLIFLAALSDVRRISLDVSSSADYVNRIAVQCDKDKGVERWSKWLMEDEIFTRQLEKDLKEFKEVGKISESFCTYYHNDHIEPVRYILNNLANDLAQSEVNKRYFSNGNTQISNDVYLKVAKAYQEFRLVLI
ncbi:MAG: hypothetical protein ACM3PZ_03485 [Bacillota bacterium]